jgi:2,4-diaminopentanoate dehydrogenase
MAKNTYRVAQWGLGNVGLRALRAVIDHPQFELVGLSVYSESKCGRDAGELCGLAPNGIRATKGVDAIVAARPDCVIYMPHEPDMEVICRLLASGINIATCCLGFNHRNSIESGQLARLEAACASGNSSLYSTGSAPGWSTEIMPFALLAMQRRLDCLTITDFADMASRNSPEMIFRFLPFGAKLRSVDPGRPNGTALSTPPSFRMTAEALGLPIDEITTSIDYAVTTKPLEIAAGRVESGTIGAIRMGITGWHGGKAVLRRFSTWYVARDIEPQWDLRDSGWRYQVEGDTPLDVTITIPVSAKTYPSISPGLTAHPVVNSVPYVCEAAPGIVHTSELPQMVPYFGQ